MDIIGFNYQQERSFEVMQAAAVNEGSAGSQMGAGVGAGMGIGMGAAMGGQMGGMMGYQHGHATAGARLLTIWWRGGPVLLRSPQWSADGALPDGHAQAGRGL